MTRDVQILNAAAELFGKRGFAAVGVDEIGQAAGVTGPAIYRHFKGKDEILGALFDEGMDELTQLTAGSFDDPWDEFRHILRQHALCVLRSPRLASVWLNEHRSLQGEHRRRFLRRLGKYIDRWTEVLHRCLPDAPDDVVLTVAYMGIGAAKEVSIWPKPLRNEHYVELLVETVVNGVAGIERLGTDTGRTARAARA